MLYTIMALYHKRMIHTRREQVVSYANNFDGKSNLVGTCDRLYIL